MVSARLVRMKIAYLITRADEVGGAQVHVRDLSSALRAAGHEVTVIAGRAGTLSEQLDRLGVPFRCVPALVREVGAWREAVALSRLRALLREVRPDLVSTHSSKAGWLGRLAACTIGVPALFTAHGWAFTDGVPEPARRIYTLAERVAAPLAERIITVSEYDRTLAIERRIALPRKIIRIHNGVHDHAERSPVTSRGEHSRIVMTGRFSAQKDHAGLFRALAPLRDMKWRLDLLGDGPSRAEAVALARSLGIADRVRFLGTRDDVREVLRGADIFALISNWEGLPRSILEAMSTGLPVVATDTGGVSEAVRDGTTGFLVPRRDDALLTARLRLLLTTPDLRRSLGAAGRRSYEQQFRFERMLERTVAVYEQVLARRAAS
jgi:glycosyltransferase involved in cell wall biosynthesis